MRIALKLAGLVIAATLLLGMAWLARWPYYAPDAFSRPPESAQAGPAMLDFAGIWVMKMGERNMFVLTLEPAGSIMKGTFERPAKFDSTNGAFANIRGGVRDDVIVVARLKDGTLRFTTRNPNNASDEDGYVMALRGNRAEIVSDDLPSGMVMQPYVFEKGAAGAKVPADWEPNRLYVASDSDTPDAEMKAIYDEDQRVRTEKEIDWSAVNKSDAERRAQTRKLLTDGALHTGKDYEEAAFVFQHGDTPQDYLLAHTLAMVAVSKGDSTAIWIAAATLDRYLQKINQKQIYGTQYSSGPQNHWTQDPYDRDLISDTLRAQLAVPSQSTQNEQLKAYQSQK
jgi:hypothetical protein